MTNILIIETINKLKDTLASNNQKISELEKENSKYLEVKTEKDITEEELKKVKQELLELKVNYNKLKMIQDNDLMDNYEKSLKEVNSKLKETESELEKNAEMYKEQIETVS